MLKNIIMRISSLIMLAALIATVHMFAKTAINSKVADTNTTFELFVKDKSVQVNQFKVHGGTLLKSDFGAKEASGRMSWGDVARAQIKVDDPAKFLIFMELEHPRGTYKYTIRPGHKTVFVSFTSNKSPALYPQTGPLKGLLGKTESGLSLKNNLKATDIVEGDTRTTLEKISGAFKG